MVRQTDHGVMLPSMDFYHLPGPRDLERDDALRHAWHWLDQRRNGKRLVVVPVRDSVNRSPTLQAISSHVPTATERTFAGGFLFETAVVMVWPTRQMLEKLHDREPAE